MVLSCGTFSNVSMMINADRQVLIARETGGGGRETAKTHST